MSAIMKAAAQPAAAAAAANGGTDDIFAMLLQKTAASLEDGALNAAAPVIGPAALFAAADSAAQQSPGAVLPPATANDSQPQAAASPENDGPGAPASMVDLAALFPAADTAAQQASAAGLSSDATARPPAVDQLKNGPRSASAPIVVRVAPVPATAAASAGRQVPDPAASSDVSAPTHNPQHAAAASLRDGGPSSDSASPSRDSLTAVWSRTVSPTLQVPPASSERAEPAGEAAPRSGAPAQKSAPADENPKSSDTVPAPQPVAAFVMALMQPATAANASVPVNADVAVSLDAGSKAQQQASNPAPGAANFLAAPAAAPNAAPPAAVAASTPALDFAKPETGKPNLSGQDKRATNNVATDASSKADTFKPVPPDRAASNVPRPEVVKPDGAQPGHAPDPAPAQSSGAGPAAGGNPATDAAPPSAAVPPAAAAAAPAAVPAAVAGSQATNLSATFQVAPQHRDSADPTAIDKLGLAIAAKSVDGVRHFDIRLDPPELGRVQVHLAVDDSGRAQASLVVDKPQTLELLQRDAPNLGRALSDAGLYLSNNGLNFSLREQSRQSDGGSVDQGRSRSLTVQAVVQTDATSTSYASLAPHSVRLDIRV